MQNNKSLKAKQIRLHKFDVVLRFLSSDARMMMKEFNKASNFLDEFSISLDEFPWMPSM